MGFFGIQDFSEGGRHTFVLSGELDIAQAWNLATALQRVRADDTAITLDLRRLTFMGSTGLRIVLLAKALCDQRGYEFRIVPGPAHIQRIFEIAGLGDRLPFTAAPEEMNPLEPAE
jgi:anti-sigma B factor antagonist